MVELSEIKNKLNAFIENPTNSRPLFSFKDFVETCRFVCELVTNEGNPLADETSEYVCFACYVFQANIIRYLHNRPTEAPEQLNANSITEVANHHADAIKSLKDKKKYSPFAKIKEAIKHTQVFVSALHAFAVRGDYENAHYVIEMHGDTRHFVPMIESCGLNGSLSKLQTVLDALKVNYLAASSNESLVLRQDKRLPPAVVLYALLMIKEDTFGALKVDVQVETKREILRDFDKVFICLANNFFMRIGFGNWSVRATHFRSSVKYTLLY